MHVGLTTLRFGVILKWLSSKRGAFFLLEVPTIFLFHYELSHDILISKPEHAVLPEWKPPVYDNTHGINLVTATTRRNSPNVRFLIFFFFLFSCYLRTKLKNMPGFPDLFIWVCENWNEYLWLVVPIYLPYVFSNLVFHVFINFLSVHECGNCLIF